MDPRVLLRKPLSWFTIGALLALAVIFLWLLSPRSGDRNLDEVSGADSVLVP